MATIQDSINYALTYIEYSPLDAGTNGNPAVTIANQIQSTILNAPFTWGFNRAQDSSTNKAPGQQDYVIPLTDFSFLEKVTLTNVTTQQVFEITDIKNTLSLSKGDTNTNKLGRPQSVCVFSIDYGTSVTLRFSAIPDTAYIVSLVYQKLVPFLTATTDSWALPNQYIDIFNNLFVGESMAVVDDARSVQYRQRGIAALLSKAEGLSQMEKELFLEQYWMRNDQQQSGTLRTQQATQARGI
jgi:hypothetical protein